MATPRRTKQRQFPVSGDDDGAIPSRARPHKPPAKVISKRKAAALATGGGKLPPRIREEFDAKPTPKRVQKPKITEKVPTRAGKREPRAARHDDAAKSRDARRR
jgi:hypothetical protein